MQTRWQIAEQVVASPASEEVHRNRCVCAFLVLIEGTFSQTKRVKKWAQMEMALSIHPVNPHGRKIGALAILLDRIVGRKKSRTCDDNVEKDEKDEPLCELAPLLHLALAAMRIRGSAQ